MFLVLTAPFPEGFKAPEDCFSCIAYKSHKGMRSIVGSLFEHAPDGTSYVDWLNGVTDELNDPPSFEFVKLMLGSIRETWQRGKRQRQEEARRLASPRRKFFGTDFGRQDFSEPGRGGHGFDSLW